MADLTGMMQAAAGQAGGENLYIEDTFSTYLYTGNGSTQTITNGIDLDGEGGLVWIKNRDQTDSHILTDTERGATEILVSNTTAAEAADADTLTAFNSDGFAIGADVKVNTSTEKYVSWAFRKAPKFFDVVTYTGNAVAGRTVAHNLGSVPGVMIVKKTNTTGGWSVYHRSLAITQIVELHSTGAAYTYDQWNSTAPSATEFTLSADSQVNGSGNTYVAYLFAHDDGGFGDDGLQNVISCGGVTLNGSGAASVTLGYEPQWILLKNAAATENWQITDSLRGMPVGGADALLLPNSSAAESTYDDVDPTATGFNIKGLNANQLYIYIAIRRGPMKTPTAGTEVLGLSARSGTGANATVTGSAGVSDAVLVKNRGSAVASLFAARLTGTGYLVTSTTAAEVAAGTTILQANPWDVMDGVKVGTTSTITNASGNTFINYLFSRAPGFMEVVAYTGNGTASTQITHNLGVAPELIIVKKRSGTGHWTVYNPLTISTNNVLYLQLSDALQSNAGVLFGNGTTAVAPTDSYFTLGAFQYTNESGSTYIAYLFASLAGVSDIGTYTGNGTSVSVTTGFQPRFILVKRTDSTGNWYVGDSARGLVAGDDPFLELNTSDAEVTNEDWVDVSGTGFTINETAANANVNTGTYIYLAIS